MASVGYRTERVLAARLQAEEDLLVGPLPQAVSASAGTDVVGYENIVGIGISERIVAGNLMSEPAIAVYVANKVVRDRVDDPAAVPPSYEGVPTDVIESGEFLPQTERGRYRPAASGVSLGHHAATAGTLGFIARREKDVYVVSNNHVKLGLRFSRGDYRHVAAGHAQSFAFTLRRRAPAPAASACAQAPRHTRRVRRRCAARDGTARRSGSGSSRARCRRRASRAGCRPQWRPACS